MADQLVGEDTAHVVQHECEADVLEDRAVAAAQDVLQVLELVVADPADVRVQARLPGAVAHLAGELGEVLRVVVQLVAVQPLQPAVPADLPQVGGHRVVVDRGPSDQENFGVYRFHAFGVLMTQHPTLRPAAWRGTGRSGRRPRRRARPGPGPRPAASGTRWGWTGPGRRRR